MIKKSILPLLILSACITAKGAETHKNNITTDGMSIIIAGQRIAVDPIEQVTITDEPIVLTARQANSYSSGNRLCGPSANTELNMFGSFVESSLIIRDSTGRTLTRNQDYIVSADFGMLALGEKSVLPIGTTVYATYSYSLQRIDALTIDKRGQIELIHGSASLKSPVIPKVPDDRQRLANIYLQYGCRELTEFNIFQLHQSNFTNATRVSPTLSKILKRLARGEKLKIICWGDSITVGADVLPAESWVERFKVMIARLHPNAQVEILNYGIGSSTSESWIKNDDSFKTLSANYGLTKGLTYEKLLAERPDIVVMEFFNDTMLPDERLDPLYCKILADFRGIGTEWVIMSPSTHLAKYNIRVMKQGDERRLMPFLRQFVVQHDLSFADAFSRWESLHNEGIPFFALFNNGFNHPNALGHQLFIEELERVFKRQQPAVN